jgi:phage terminase large subunit-like protein
MPESYLSPLLPMRRKAAIKFYAEKLTAAAVKSPEHLRQAKRWLCRNDLFFLLVYGCKRKDINKDWLFDRCREVQANPNGYLDLWAREHYKSTIITFGMSILDILASHGDNPEPRYNGREVTIGIFSHTHAIAADFLKQIKQEFEKNIDLKALFPEILWSRPSQAPQWSVNGGITVKRTSNPKEATVEACGVVEGQPIGKHYLIRVYDDLVTDDSVSTSDQINKTTHKYRMSDNLGTEGGWQRMVGTIYHLHDTYSVLRKEGAVIARIYPCTKDGTEKFVPGNCVLKSPEELKRKRKSQGPYVFGSQMLLNPTNDTSQGFNTSWLRYWQARHFGGLNIYLLVDPASGKKAKEGRGDYTVMMVIGLGADKKYRLIDGFRSRLNPTQRVNALFDLHRKWKPIKVGYEDYGMQSDIHYIEKEMEDRNYEFEVVPLGGKLRKEDRIKQLIPVFERGDFLLPNSLIYTDHEGKAVDLIRTFIDEEYDPFPLLKHDDMLDDMARILDPALDVEWPKEEHRRKETTVQQKMRAHLRRDNGGGFMTS